MRSEFVLETNKLKKHFGKVRAVEEVSLSVSRGQVYGFLGPNGSGKTTTIGMVLGLIHPTSGKVRLFGERVSPGHSMPLRRVGAIVGAPALVPYFSARQNLDLLTRLNPDLPEGRVEEILETVGLTEASNRRAGRYSTGMKQRLGLAMAMLHNPELLVLDEPTNGMDPAGMREIRNLLRELANHGVTVFISSHLLHEVEQICDRVAILKHGQVVAEGEVKDLLNEEEIVRVRVTSPVEAAKLLQRTQGVARVQPNGNYISISGLSSQSVVAQLTAHGIIPSEVITVQQDLESIFIELTGSSPNQEPKEN
jgi:ABC-2 type transport system ATP-binding protein